MEGNMSNNKKMNGFTLIELSIVIVIIGFLVAGITVGANMIKQAQIRSVITEMQRYQTSYNNYLARFNAVPGDMINAYSFWPSTNTSDPKYCGSAANCNGNGDGLISWRGTLATGTDGGNEVVKAWRHLALAEMISAGVNPIGFPTDTGGTLILGQNAPNSKIQNAGYFIAGADQATATGGPQGTYLIGTSKSSAWVDSRTNAVFLGRPSANTTFIAGALKAEEAYNIDTKIDDGMLDSSSNPSVFRGANTGVLRALDQAGDTNTCVNVEGTYNVVDNGNDVCVVGMALN